MGHNDCHVYCIRGIMLCVLVVSVYIYYVRVRDDDDDVHKSYAFTPIQAKIIHPSSFVYATRAIGIAWHSLFQRTIFSPTPDCERNHSFVFLQSLLPFSIPCWPLARCVLLFHLYLYTNTHKYLYHDLTENSKDYFNIVRVQKVLFRSICFGFLSQLNYTLARSA